MHFDVNGFLTQLIDTEFNCDFKFKNKFCLCIYYTFSFVCYSNVIPLVRFTLGVICFFLPSRN